MKLSNYAELPADIPVIAEDDIFLYPFMISPIFLGDNENIKAVTTAMEENTLVMVTPTKPSFETRRSFDAIYDAGVVGSIMRKVSLPDGRIKILFQGLARAKILKPISSSPLIATVDTIKPTLLDDIKAEAILAIVREKVKTLSSITNYFPPDLLRTIDENHDYNRIIDLIASTIKLKKEQAYKLFVEENTENRFFLLIDYLIEEIEANKLQKEIRSKVNTKIEQAN
jgi:ATP-dependent Lon protease